MGPRRNLSTSFLVGFFAAWLSSSSAFAATATLSDLTDFITRLGGYLYSNSGPSADYYYWQQMSYTVTTSGGGSTNSGGNSNTSGGGSPTSSSASNITKIIVSKFPKAAVRIATGTGATPIVVPANNASISNQLYACAVENYTVETVILDFRDIKPTTNAPKSNITIVDKDSSSHKIWSVVMQKNDAANNFIRITTQTLPANCPMGGATVDAKMEQTDLPQHSILFSDLIQAKRFVQLLNNVIPTLNPPVLIPAPK
jgi:hypothetical protein